MGSDRPFRHCTGGCSKGYLPSRVRFAYHRRFRRDSSIRTAEKTREYSPANYFFWRYHRVGYVWFLGHYIWSPFDILADIVDKHVSPRLRDWITRPAPCNHARKSTKQYST